MSVGEALPGLNRYNNSSFAAVMESGERFGLFLREHYPPGSLVEVRISRTPSIFAVMNASGYAGLLHETGGVLHDFSMGSPRELENFRKHYGKMDSARTFMIIPVWHTMNNSKGDESKVVALIEAHDAHKIFDRVFSDTGFDPEARLAFRGAAQNNWDEIVDFAHRARLAQDGASPFDWPTFRQATPAAPAPLRVRANEFIAIARAQTIKPPRVLP